MSKERSLRMGTSMDLKGNFSKLEMGKGPPKAQTSLQDSTRLSALSCPTVCLTHLSIKSKELISIIGEEIAV